MRTHQRAAVLAIVVGGLAIAACERMVDLSRRGADASASGDVGSGGDGGSGSGGGDGGVDGGGSPDVGGD